MPRAKERDGVYQRPDRPGWWVSYMDASGKRQRRKVQAHTRRQAMDVLSAIRTGEERARTLGVRSASEITTADLLARYTRHQKPRIRPTTYERLGGILATLETHLPQQAKTITKRIIAEYIETRSEMVKPGTVAKEMSVLKHCLRLAVEWGLLNENAAAGATTAETPCRTDTLSHPRRTQSRARIGSRLASRPNGVRGLHRSAAGRDALASLDGRGHEQSSSLPARDQERRFANPAHTEIRSRCAAVASPAALRAIASSLASIHPSSPFTPSVCSIGSASQTPASTRCAIRRRAGW